MTRRQMSYSPRPAKRARTLTNEVQTLKKKVASNTKELKYYDGSIIVLTTTPVTNQSIFKNNYAPGGSTDNPIFIGRKAHIKKIELRLEFNKASTTGTQLGKFLMWREKRPGKDVTGFETPLALDPEYHTLLRSWEYNNDTDCLVKNMVIDFGNPGRVVEFDETTSATATGDIVTGDIRINFEPIDSVGTTGYPVTYRVWYYDG